jgi:hypothetical protein
MMILQLERDRAENPSCDQEIPFRFKFVFLIEDRD